ncbi:MAG: carbamoyl-phosphate synthase large subunit, partial [Pelagibacteraceae bacterium]
LNQVKEIINIEQEISKKNILENRQFFNLVKSSGFSDKKISSLTDVPLNQIIQKRSEFNILPVYKKVDTCAAEFSSQTPYMYSTYDVGLSDNRECESNPTTKEKVVIIGGGPNRIGQGIEFDYCCCQASYALNEIGFETIMINCNPETVSTDYDTSDRLYFEPLIEEYVLEILKKESSQGKLKGVIVQFGGQTPLKLAKAIHDNNYPILGTSLDSIDLTEDRERFSNLINKLNLKQAENGLARSKDQAYEIAKKIKYPLVIRPSYVLGGRAMEIIHDDEQLKTYIEEAVKVSGNNPVLLDRFLNDAIEVDVDAICDGTDVFVSGVMEHIEEAGIHSGDSACCIPPYSLSKEIIKEIEHQTKTLAINIGVIGLINIQFAIQGKNIYVLEVNPRASRTVPFVSKASNISVAKLATKVMSGIKLQELNIPSKKLKTFSVKEAVFPFNKFPEVDILLGPEMKSTGESMGIDLDFGMAYAKSQISAGNTLPKEGMVFISVNDKDKPFIKNFAKKLFDLGFEILATGRTAETLTEANIACTKINKATQGSPHIVEYLDDKKIAIVINTTSGKKSIEDSKSLRRSALNNNIPYFTTLAGAIACTEAIISLKNKKMGIMPIQDL